MIDDVRSMMLLMISESQHFRTSLMTYNHKIFCGAQLKQHHSTIHTTF